MKRSKDLTFLNQLSKPYDAVDEVDDLISQSLSDYKKELVEEIKGQLIDPPSEFFENGGNLSDADITWNAAIDRVLSLLQKDKEDKG